MRIFINKCTSELFIKAKKKPLKYTMQMSDKNRICVGMPLIAKVNNRDHEIANNEMFIVTKCEPTKDKISIESECKTKTFVFGLKEFEKIFELAFAITCHRSQGSTFDRPYKIFEWKKYSDKMKYVAVTRATKMEYINFDNQNMTYDR